MKSTGESSSGKTLIATNLMIAAQKAGGAAIFIDFERFFNPKFAAKNGLNVKEGFVYHKPRHWEEGNSKIIELGPVHSQEQADPRRCADHRGFRLGCCRARQIDGREGA